MFERFTDRARRVVVLAQEQSRAMRHSSIGTEHLLLGLFAEQEGVAARAFESLGVTETVVRQAVVSRVPPGRKEPSGGHIPFQPAAKKALELSLREALSLHHNYIGTEHLALGLARVDGSPAAEVLTDLGVDYRTLRQKILELIAAFGSSPGLSVTQTSAHGMTQPVQVALEHARTLAGSAHVSSDRLLLALLDDQESAGRRALDDAGIDIQAVTRALRSASVVGTSDESEPERGRRMMRLRLQDRTLFLECTDPVLIELAESAGLSAAGLSGDSDEGVVLVQAWSVLHHVLQAMRAAAQPAPQATATGSGSPETNRPPRRRRTPRKRPSSES